MKDESGRGAPFYAYVNDSSSADENEDVDKKMEKHKGEDSSEDDG